LNVIRVLALVPYPRDRVPGQRYRLEQWAPLLAAENVAVTFAPFLDARAMEVLYRGGHVARKVFSTARGYARRLRTALDSRGYDVAYVYREAALLGPPWLERLLARRLPVVFDFDDAIYLGDASAANAWVRPLKPRGKTEAICRLARHVVTGNETLAAFARRHARAVTVVPSTIDTDRYRVHGRPPNARPVVGWTGSQTTLRHLATIAPALRRLREVVDFELRVIGGEVNLDGLDVRCLPWRAASEAEDLRPLDVGLMPLPDDEWSRGKCGMKALQYMALGIPPVVSPVGANATIVRHGVNGQHASTEQQWVDGIRGLLADGAARARLGQAARQTVEETYSARVQGPRMARLLRDAAR
jgi:glycosyltransferase involved in cell wall biosynthesis